MLAFVMVLTILTPFQSEKVSAASALKVKTGKTMEFEVGDTATIKLNVKNSQVTFKSSNKKIVTVSSKGKVKAVACGKAKITVKSKTSSAKLTITVKVIPSKVKNVTAEESGNTGVKIKWSTQKTVTGYEIYSSDKLNGTYKLVKTVTSPKTGSVTLTGLTPSKTFYYKVKAYKKVGSQKYKGEISDNNKNEEANSKRTTHQKSKKYFNSAKTYKLVWSDEFNYTDTNKLLTNWVYEIGNGQLLNEKTGRMEGNIGWGNKELEFYTSGKNVLLTGSELVIKPNYQKASDVFSEQELKKIGLDSNPDTMVYTSTRMKTAGKKQFRYGKVEFRCILPSAQGTWAAAWMLGTGNNWPHSGEIDVLETLSVNDWFVKDKIPQSIHCGQFNGLGKPRANIHQEANVVGSTQQYHTYGIVWTDTDITFLVDGKVTYTYNPLMYSREASYNVWPYDDPFYLIMNVAIGGVLCGGTNVDQAAVCSKLGEMKIDYVRVCQ